MYVGKVVGSVVATVKDAALTGIKLLVVEVIENGKPTRRIIAGDATRQAGPGDFVYLIGSKEAAAVFKQKLTPCDAAICGFIDDYNEVL
ncbi:MAG: ethanolamine utilization protein EutN [Christensenellaceae bacterium]|nr:ethanolamine utilization protein EutN [Christensenellaceae bacterium]